MMRMHQIMVRSHHALLALLLAGAARGEVGGRLSLSGMVLGEQGDRGGADGEAANALLGYGDLRGIIDGRRLGPGVAFRGDFRLRLTGHFDEASARRGEPQISARGYAGGREYELREAWVGGAGERFSIAAGRVVVVESDALTLDGLRGTVRLHRALELSLWGGLAPSPFSRSLDQDYPSLAGGGGLGLLWAAPWIRGSLALCGLYLGGPDDGGAIVPERPAAEPGRTEAPRLFATLGGYLRATGWLAFHEHLVVDFTGAAGLQVTRATVAAVLHPGPVRIHLGYGHLSSLALELYLVRLLQDRRSFQLGTVENNLVVQRTARDEGRLMAGWRIKRLDLYVDGRVRRRALAAAGEDPNFKERGEELAFDLTAGLRDDGDLLGLRLHGAFTELLDYRGESQIVTAEIGRDFAAQALRLDLSYRWQRNRDFAADGTAPCVPTQGLGQGCYGRRRGDVHELGLLVGVHPGQRLSLLGEYRFVHDARDGGGAIQTHVGWLRLEVRL